MAHQARAAATSLPENALLLAFPRVGPASDNLRFVVAASALVPLIETGRVVIDNGRVTVANPEPTGSRVLDGVIADLAEQKKPPKLLNWVMKRGRQTTQSALAELERAGLVTRERRRVLGIFPRRRWQPDPAAHERIRNDIRRALVEGQDPDDATAALIGLMAAGKQGRLLWDKEERQVAQARLGEIHAGGQVLALMDAVTRAIKLKEAAAASAGAAAASGS